MLKKLRNKPIHQKLAEKVVKEANPDAVGAFLGHLEEEPHLSSYRFEAKLKGYLGWEWQVVIYQAKKTAPATISEVVLIPGENAIVAPNWVPWSDRRAELDRVKADESAAADLEPAEDSQTDSEDAGERPPVGKRIRRRLVKNQKED
jgi:hypothetical protein